MRVTFKSMFVVYTPQKNTLNLKVEGVFYSHTFNGYTCYTSCHKILNFYSTCENSELECETNDI